MISSRVDRPQIKRSGSFSHSPADFSRSGQYEVELLVHAATFATSSLRTKRAASPAAVSFKAGWRVLVRILSGAFDTDLLSTGRAAPFRDRTYKFLSSGLPDAADGPLSGRERTERSS